MLAGILITVQAILAAAPAFPVTGETAKKAASQAAKGAAKEAVRKPAQDKAPEVADLPITELPQGSESTDMLGILISGDGGWWSLDDTVSKTFAGHGIPVIGISSHYYFAKPRTPDETASDMYRALRFYMKKWNKQRIVLLGYSLGAEIIPFVATRVPEDLRGKVVLVVMIGPTAETAFEFHLSDWVVSPTKRAKFPVQPEIEKISGPKVLCVTSSKDAECICDKLDPANVMELKREGNHHFNDDFKGLADAIWEKAKEVLIPPPAPAGVPATSKSGAKASAKAPASIPATAKPGAPASPPAAGPAKAPPPAPNGDNHHSNDDFKSLASTIWEQVKKAAVSVPTADTASVPAAAPAGPAKPGAP